jgi:TPR repeat protein
MASSVTDGTSAAWLRRGPEKKTQTPATPSPARAARPAIGRRTIAISAGAAVVVAATAAAWALWPRAATTEHVADRTDLASACEKKDSAACMSLGELAWAAPDGARDLAAAERGFQTACDAGEPRGCVRLAHLYEDAVAFDAKKGNAQELRRRASGAYEKWCEAQDAYACLVLASLTITGKGVQKNTPRAMQLYTQARQPLEAQCDNAATPPAAKIRTCNALSLMLSRGLGGAKDAPKSLDLLEQTCALGDTAACMLAGSTFADGPGVREIAADPPRAPAPYKKGCELGDPRACHALAKLLHGGAGAAANATEVLALETKACDSGVASACMEVGQMTFSGEAGIADPKKAREWFVKEVTLRQKQCDAGLGEECVELAANYRSRGQGVPIDPTRVKDLEDKALATWQAGCDAGVWSECLALRTRLEKEPMPDLKRVRALRERECALGYEHTCRRLGIAYAPPRP